MATYLNDLRLTELATGEGSGTWGTTTNLSLELIGEALGFATQQVFGSDADATTTIADGASDPARAMYFKITSAGSLTATRTCTIAPNTISRVMFIENATTGSQSIQISQGSGASVTILAGKTAVVYLDGAGSGAAVVDAMAGVDPGVTDTLAEVLAAGNTSGANNLIIDNGQAITTNTINETTAASGVTIDSVLLKDDGVNATNLEITNIKANDGTSAGSIADSTGVVTLASSVLTTADINGGTIDGTTLGATTPASVAATTGSFSSTLGVTGAATFSSTVAGAFNGTLGATTPASVAATTLSTTGAATFSRPDNENLFIADTTNTTRSSLQVSSDITFFNGNIDTASHGNFVWRSSNAYTERMRIDSSGGLITNPAAGGHAVFNEAGVDADFRVESDTNANAFFLDASNGNIGMGGTSNVPLNIYRNGAGNTELLRLTNDNTNNHNFYVFVNDDDNMVRFGSTGDNGGNFAFLETTNTNDSIVLYTAGGATFNELGNDSDFRVESDGNATICCLLMVVMNHVNIGTATDFGETLNIDGGIHTSATMFVSRQTNDTGSSGVMFEKTRSTTVNGNTIVQNGDQLGYIGWSGNDGDQFIGSAYIIGYVDGAPGNNDMPTRLDFLVTADGSDIATNRMRLGSSGAFTTYPAARRTRSLQRRWRRR
jgi:hypothetical protein